MRSIRSDEKFEEMIRNLSHPVTGKPIFPTMRDLICFAAVLGFEHEKRVELNGKTFEVVGGRIFEGSSLAMDLLYLVSLANEKSADILREEEPMLKIFEEYAQGGLEILQGWLREKPEDTNGDKAILEALHKYNFLAVRDDTPIDEIKITF
jgi:dnd system-associated protein 4